MASKLVMILVFIFDLIAFGLAIAAEQRRSVGKVTNDSENNYKYCVYESDIATGYGVGAFLFVLASHVLLMVVSRCFCCGKALKPGGSRACAVLLFILCWQTHIATKRSRHTFGSHLLLVIIQLTFFIAESCLLAGSVRNAYHTKYTRKFFDDPPSCETVRRGVFAAGAAFVFLLAVISEFYYLAYSKSRGSFTPHNGDAGVGMAAYQ